MNVCPALLCLSGRLNRIDVVKKVVDNDPHALVRRCLQIILTRDNPDNLRTTYEGIYSACRSIVTVSNKGEGLYGTIKMELEKSANRLAKGLTEFTDEGMNWIVEFVKVCQWFEKQVVSQIVVRSRKSAHDLGPRLSYSRY